MTLSPAHFAAECKKIAELSVARYIFPEVVYIVVGFIDWQDNGLVIATRELVDLPEGVTDEVVKSVLQNKFRACVPKPLYSGCTLAITIAVPCEGSSRGRRFMDIDTLTRLQQYAHVVDVTLHRRDEYGRPFLHALASRNVSYSLQSDSWIPVSTRYPLQSFDWAS